MKPKLLIVFLLIVLLPLVTLGWLGARLVRNEREVVQHRFRDVLTGRLKDIDAQIAGLIDERERDLMSLDLSGLSAESLRDLARRAATVRQLLCWTTTANWCTRLHGAN